MTLAPCPCGKTPDKLCFTLPMNGVCFVSGICCGSWEIRFDDDGEAPIHELAAKAWNKARRGCECAAICECGHPRILHYVESNWGCPDPCGCDQYKRVS